MVAKVTGCSGRPARRWAGLVLLTRPRLGDHAGGAFVAGRTDDAGGGRGVGRDLAVAVSGANLAAAVVLAEPGIAGSRRAAAVFARAGPARHGGLTTLPFARLA